MRMFASDRVSSIMERLKWPDDEPIQAKMVTRAVENAQQQIEELNYERRKNVLKYDDVMNAQREVIYGERRKILEGQDFKEQALGWSRTSSATRRRPVPRRTSSPRNGTSTRSSRRCARSTPCSSRGSRRRRSATSPSSRRSSSRTRWRSTRRRKRRAAEAMRELERMVLLNITDTKWREHLYEMDYLQEGIHLRAYAQKDPLTEYQREAYDMFEELTESIRDDFVRYIYRVEFVRPETQAPQPTRVQDNRAEVESQGKETANADQAVSDKMPRNAPCPCGSGKKYKKCHGAVA